MLPIQSNGVPAPIPFRQTLGPLAIAALAGVAVLIAPNATDAHAASSGFVLYALIIAAYVCATAAVIVLPAFAIWPAARRPHWIVALLWGAAASGCAFYVLVGRTLGFISLRNLALTALPGAVSGLCYVWLVRLQRA